MPFDVQKIRKEFPILVRKVNKHPLIYLDNAASTQKPSRVINALKDYYEGFNANIHRGVHTLAGEATNAFEQTRKVIAQFLGVENIESIIFTQGTTGAINTIAYSFCETFLNEGDEVLITGLEHHSNIVPWQLQTQRKKARLKVIPLNHDATLDLTSIDKLLTEKTKILAVTHCNNALGIINPIELLIEKAHQKGVPVLIDGAQAASFIDLNMKKLDADFYALSAHKIFGPTGTGILYGKEKWLASMIPYMAGGEMIENVSFEKTTFNKLPYKFEAGTPNIADVIATKEAVNFITEIGKKNIRTHEDALLKQATQQLLGIDGLHIYGDVPQKAAIISFSIENIHPFDIGQMLDAQGIAVRTGHHCNQPLIDFLGIEGTVRMSFSVYNTMEEIDKTMKALKKVIQLLR